jgi:hypothetical protein
MNCRFLIIALLCLACTKSPSKPESGRNYRMGFQNSAPRFDNFDLFLQTLNIWTSRADAATITLEVPWDTLYAGTSPEAYIQRNFTGLVNYYRSKQMEIWVAIDPQNGLNRATDAAELKKRGRSIAEKEVQDMYRKFVWAMDSLLQPSHLSLAMETNLIRLAAPASIYQGVKQAAKDAAIALQQKKSKAILSISVQAETAWGHLQGTHQYLGVEQDFADFPFVQELGISSYPYFGMEKPEDLPDQYYSSLRKGRTLPIYIAEGGWSTVSFKAPNGFNARGSEDLQKRYLRKQDAMLRNAGAIAWFQLVFTDLDTAAIPAQVDPNILNFAFLGLVDKTLRPKAALAVWDSLYAIPFRK